MDDYSDQLSDETSCGGQCVRCYSTKQILLVISPRLQMELVSRFPPSEVDNLRVWQHVLLRALSLDARHRVEKDVVSMSDKALSDWQGDGHKLGGVKKLVSATSHLILPRFCAFINGLAK